MDQKNAAYKVILVTKDGNRKEVLVDKYICPGSILKDGRVAYCQRVDDNKLV